MVHIISKAEAASLQASNAFYAIGNSGFALPMLSIRLAIIKVFTKFSLALNTFFAQAFVQRNGLGLHKANKRGSAFHQITLALFVVIAVFSADTAFAQTCTPTSNRVTSGTFPTTGGNTNTVAGWTVGGTTSAVWPAGTGKVFLGANGLEFRRDQSTTTTFTQNITNVNNYGQINLTNLYWVRTLVSNSTATGILTVSYAGTVYATINTQSGTPQTPIITASNGATVNIATLQPLSTTGTYTTSTKVNLAITLPSGIPASGALLLTFTAAADSTEVNDVGMSAISFISCAAAIKPVTESGTAVSGTASTPIANVRTNDTVNGAAATSANSTIATSGAWPAGITLNTTTGAISVASSVLPGTYSITYRLCDTATPVNCNTVADTITVSAVITPVTESGTAVSGTASTAIANVRTNDTVNGAAATSANSTIATSGAWPAGITLNTTTGAVNVTSSVLPGTYSITYQLCDTNTPVNCNTVADSITVIPSVDMVVLKSNGTTTVTKGGTTTYTVTVTNSGPDAAIGSLVKDTPGAGITCSAGNPVVITGSGVPAGSFTIANLTGAGITLGTLNNGQSATLTYSCQVN